ncbi:MAG: flagellar hook basal-body protein [Planctomycetota bacterium]|nr:flagellar hook basal-body protein [Planctomycetota bacterium]
MNYGLYLSANGISSTQHRMNVLANNLANANTTAFKPSAVVLGERAREPQQLDTLTNSSQLLEQLGGGTEIAYTGLDLTQGSVETTGIRTNLAIKGEGFLHLDGGRNDARNLTRDGNLVFDAGGILRHQASGHAVLDERGNRIQLDASEQRRFDGFGPRGELLDRENPFGDLGRVALVDAPALSLTPRGQNLIETREELAVAGDAQVVGSALEQSAANPISGMVELIKLTRQIEMNSRMMQYQDAMIGQAVTALARVV